MKTVPAIVATCLLLVPGAATGQACAEPHYRWSEKTDTTFETRAAAPISVSDILTNWAPLALTSRDPCAPRSGREDSVFAVTGWLRRIHLHEADGDWHIELTQEQTTPVTSCLIVEIPAERYGTVYGQARAALAALVDTTRLSPAGDLVPPVRVRVSGAAFFDGYHQREPSGGGGGPSQAVGHGRCNASLKALWEIHPVYRVTTG
jgi:hypothetical protein